MFVIVAIKALAAKVMGNPAFKWVAGFLGFLALYLLKEQRDQKAGEERAKLEFERKDQKHASEINERAAKINAGGSTRDPGIARERLRRRGLHVDSERPKQQ